ncbi:RNA-guided pseudouridylation complex pseudouridine synthase subunit Cbf5 [Haloplanus salilacus]|uniref:RNA-guided pseudouridylation complex pseudouridine synthase subunit Cbf5 n=1 Tax=Haloplanus salilacus TaxID=2949994 RepID=UPI0030CB1521
MRLRAPPGDRDLTARLEFGVVNLDKPPGPSAHQVAGWVRDLAGVDRAAHAGTLDPKVTGCLPIMLGDATRLAPVFLEGRKEYVAVLELHDRRPADLDDVLAEFEGEIYQKPPRKSAVSRRLRTRTIHAIDILETRDRQVLLRIECASGTYVRKLCHDLGLALGTGAHMGHLRRTATDPFDDRDLVTLHDLADALAVAEEGNEGPIREVVAPAERVLGDLPAVTVAPSAAEQVATGAPVYAPGVLNADESDPDALVACYTPDGSAVCLGRRVGDPDADEGLVVDLERVLV